MNKRRISALLITLLLFSSISNTALASNTMLEVQGSNIIDVNATQDIEEGNYSLDGESVIIESSDKEIVVDYDKKDENNSNKQEIEEKQVESEVKDNQNTVIQEEKVVAENEGQTIEEQKQEPQNNSELEGNLQEEVKGPQAVGSLKYKAINYKKISLSWESSIGATHYGVYRSTVMDGNYEEVSVTTKTSYEGAVECGLVYYYKVIPFADGVEGEAKTISVVTKPDKVTKLKATRNLLQVSLSWKAGKGAKTYEIYRSVKKSSGYTKIGETKKTKYTDKKTVQGKKYYYKIYSKGNETLSSGVRTSKSIAIPSGPKAVTSLKYKATSYNSISLSWKKSKGATKYIIYRATSKDGTYKKIKTTTSTKYEQKKVASGKVYYYKVVPYTDKIPGKEKVIKAYTTPDKITKINISVSENSIAITWSKAKGAASYEIQRSTQKNSGYEKIAEVTKKKYTDKNLEDGKTYYYRVYALSNGTKSKKATVYATIPTKSTADTSKEMRAVWISYLDYGTLKDKSKSDFTKNINTMYDKVLAANANTVIVHVRAFSDAVYPSSYYKWGNFITSNANGPNYDPLQIMVEEAHKKGLSFQAWINPYRTADGGRVNPASTSAIKKIVSGVEEIVRNYNVDGIHFDDYFYLSTDTTSQEEKMKNVNKMVSQVYAKIKSIKPEVVFGISPAGNVEYAKSIGCDLETWLSTSGYIDYICPQLYWSDDYVTKGGASTKMFTTTMKQWAGMNKNNTAMYAGLALYKVGESVESTWGSDRGWGTSRSNLYNQYKASKNTGYVGYSLYRYESLSLPAAKEELNNLSKLLK